MSITFKQFFTDADYIELCKCLDNKRKLFLQAFKDFENLPNLHANYHLVQHARNYTTLLNTSVGTKEMVHLRHLFDSGIDKHFPLTNNTSMNLLQFKSLMNDWSIIEKPVNPENINEDFYRELASVYRKMGYELAFFEVACRYYELACFLVKDNKTDTCYYLYVGDVVTISEKEDKSFAILRSIFSHKRDNQHFAFIIIDRFELTNQKKLECPVYRLQNTREICPISEVDTNNTAHFIYYCNDNECIIGSEHNFENDLYIKNAYFFKAI
ncbi:hypothetical protein F8M41_025457 [Gigaspora margarita]|uniref:Uncharacterized protein n=1 Tax=Gigaspora margarita TaxID=4874 RepID=A0A8H4B006_GIGMA|nr:hypothetical protein F8M41_025457 [Gigaspora margarita]